MTQTTPQSTDAETFAYFKRTAPVEDVKFQLRLTLPDQLRERYEALLSQLEQQKGKATTATKTEYRRLLQTWRETYCASTPAKGRAPKQPRKTPRADGPMRPTRRKACSKCGAACSTEELGSRTDCRTCRQAYRQQRKHAA